MQSELLERRGEQMRRSDVRPAAAAEGFVSRDDPQSSGAHVAVDVIERHDPDRGVVLVRGVDPDEVSLTLHHDLEQRRRDALPVATEIEPPGVLFELQPGGGQLEIRSEEHTSELQSQSNLVCRLLLEKKKKQN